MFTLHKEEEEDLAWEKEDRCAHSLAPREGNPLMDFCKYSTII